MQNLNNQRPAAQLSISRLICVPTERAQPDMYQRSFSMGMTQGDTNELQTFFQRNGVANNANLSLAGVAGSLGHMVQLSATPTGTVGIPNGWGTERLLYMLSVEEPSTDNTWYTHYVQGYTDYNDSTMSGRIDPNVPFRINSITTVIRTRNMYTNQVESRVLETFNLVTTQSGGYTYESQTMPGHESELIRPSDVINNLTAKATYSDLPGVPVHVKSGSITNGGNVSRKSNNDALKYFANTVNAVISGKSMGVGYGAEVDVLTEANGLLMERYVTDNAFIAAIARLTGELEPSSFTLNNLLGVDPSVSSKLTLVAKGELVRDVQNTQSVLDTDNAENLLNYSAESAVAQLVVNSLTATMADNLLTVLSGTVTNMQGTPITTVANINSFLEGVDITSYGNRVVNYINSVIMPQVTRNGLFIASIVFDCDVLGSTSVNVCIDNGPAITYRFPTYADSLYTPVLTDAGTKDVVVGDFELVADMVMGMGPEFQGVNSGY